MEDFAIEDIAGNESREEPDKINFMEKFVKGVRKGFLGVLFMMSKDTRQSKAFSIITMIVNAFQLSALATPSLFTTEMVMHPSLMAINTVANTFELTQYFSLGKNTLTTITIVLVALLLLNAIYVGFSYVRSNSPQKWAVSLLRRIAIVFTGVLYIPLVTLMSSSLFCNTGETACQTLRPISGALLVLFVVFTISVTSVFYDARNDGVTPVQMPHSRVAVLHKGISTMLAALAGLLPGMFAGATPTTVIHFWAGLLTGCSLVLLFSYVWLQPYYSHRINSLRAMLVATIMWISLAFLVSDAYTGFSLTALPVPTAVFSVGLFCTLPIVRLLISYRRTKLLDPCRRHKIASMFPALDAELKVRLMIEEAQKMQRVEAALGTEKGDATKNIELAKEVMKEASDIYSEVSERLHESSQISVLHAQFLLFEIKKPLLARRALLLAEARSPSLDESFMIFKTKKYLEENAFQSNDILSFVNSERHLQLSHAYDKRCCMLLVHFWTTLGDPKMEVNQIRKLADLIGDAAALAEDSYKQLIKLRPDDALIMETYAGFVETIGNDPEEARKFELRAQDLKQRQVKRVDAGSLSINASSAILTVDASGTPLENGRVLAANTVAGLFFKQPTDFLVNKAIGELLLPPFANGFDAMVASYLEQAEEAFFNKPFDTYVRLGMGTELTLLPCQLVVKPFTNDGVNFQMYFSLTELHTSTADVALVDPTTLAIVGVTRGLRGLMSSLAPLTSDSIEGSTISIEEAISDYGRLVKMWRGGAAFQHDLTKVVQRAIPGTVTLQVSVVRLHGPTSPALDKITFTMEGSKAGFKADSGSELEYSANSSNADADSDADSDADAEAEAEAPAGSDDDAADFAAPTAPKEKQKKTVGFQETMPVVARERGSMEKSEPAGSVTGGSSSVGSTGTTAASIRRAMLASRHKLDAHLFRFRRLFVYTTIVSMCMIIAMYGVRSTSLAAHEADDPSEAGARRLMAVSISYFAHALVLMNNGISLPCGLTEPVAREELRTLGAQLIEIENKLYHRQAGFAKELKFFYENRAVAMREIGSTGTPVVVDRTIFDASMLMAGSAETGSRMSLDKYTNENPEVYMMIHNVRHHDHAPPGAPVRLSYLEALNTTTMVYTYQNSAFLPMMNMASMIVATVVVVVSMIILIIILLPAVNKIDTTKSAVFHELVGMPSQVFPVVGKRYKQRLELVHGEADVAGAEDKDDDEDEDEIDEMTMQGTLQNVDTTNKPPSVGTKSDKAKKAKKNTENLDAALRANSVRCRVMTRMSGNIIVFILYFTVTLYVSFLMEIRVKDAPNQSNYGGLRAATLRLAVHELRMFTTGGMRYGGWDIHEDEMDAEFDHLAGIHEALVYGDYNRGLHGILHSRDTNVDQEDLMFTHGCFRFEPKTNRPEAHIPPCEEYREGLVAAGLHRSTLSIISMGHLLGHQTAIRIGEAPDDLHLLDGLGDDAPAAGGGHRLRRMLEADAHAPAEDAHGDAAEEDGHDAAEEDGHGSGPQYDSHGVEIPAEDDGHGAEKQYDSHGVEIFTIDPNEPDHYLPEDLNATLNTDMFTQLCEMEEYYLQPMLATSIYLYRAQEHRIVDEEELVQQVALGVLCVLSLMLYILVVRRLVNNLDDEVKRTRGLLLMIPDDILTNLSGLRKLLAQEVASQR